MPGALYPLIKRTIDATAAAAGLLVCAPVLAVAAVAIKLGDSGPMLYRGERVGVDGRRFWLLKFRTMSVDTERNDASSTPVDDPRVRRVGAVLRRYKLDELPQLINVLKGEMSLVGPRPQVAWAVALYTPEERRLLSVRPGITDYASIRFRDEGEILRGSTDPDRDYLEKIAPEKIRLGLTYVDTLSFGVDCRIIAGTVWALSGRDPKWLFDREGLGDLSSRPRAVDHDQTAHRR